MAVSVIAVFLHWTLTMTMARFPNHCNIYRRTWAFTEWSKTFLTRKW